MCGSSKLVAKVRRVVQGAKVQARVRVSRMREANEAMPDGAPVVAMVTLVRDLWEISGNVSTAPSVRMHSADGSTSGGVLTAGDAGEEKKTQ